MPILGSDTAAPMDSLEQMLQDIRLEAEITAPYTGRGHIDARVLEAMAQVPRERFVPAQLRHRAYENGPLPIGHGQTISQPFIVALMTDLLATRPDHRLLEIGTGSGYQTAILAHLVQRVYGLEIVPELARAAQARLHALGYDNVEVHMADGHAGLAQHAPYDGILIAAATPQVPPALLAQLKPGGRLVAPLGQPGWSQTLTLLEKRADGGFNRREVLDVVFVPLTGAGDTTE